MHFFFLITVFIISSNLLFAQGYNRLSKKELQEINTKQTQEIDSMKYLIEKLKTEKKTYTFTSFFAQAALLNFDLKTE